MSYRSILKRLVSDDKEDSHEEPEVEDSTSAGFVYIIEDFDDENPTLQFLLQDYDDKSLTSLAHLIAPMSHPDFFYLVLARLKKDFDGINRPGDYDKLLSKILDVKETFVDETRPYITPLDLSRARNE